MIGGWVGETVQVPADVARVLFTAGFSQSPPWIEITDGWEPSVDPC